MRLTSLRLAAGRPNVLKPNVSWKLSIVLSRKPPLYVIAFTIR